MKYAQQYLLSAIQIMQQYDGSMPLAAFLKKHFTENKKFGSKDRKNIAHLCYAYCRIGNAGATLPIENRFKIALFLVSGEEDGWAILFDESWRNHWFKQLDDKLIFVVNQYPAFSVQEIFPCASNISNTMPFETFSISHLIQPDVFLRLRPGKYEAVRKQIKTADIPFTKISETCFALSNSVKIDTIVSIDRDVVVQDRSSQRISEIFEKIETDKTKAIQLWDCCAASGGKTILARDFFGVMDITVSDIRASILHNLKARFERAGIKYFQSITTDLSKSNPQKPTGKFDLILADVPCSGSGTWGRTPEQLSLFKEEKILEYTALQKNILSNIISSLSLNGYLLYSTCSVYKAENEDQKDFILSTSPSLKLIEEKYLIGYTDKADTMYAALFRKQSLSVTG
jgi:16S rRNA (cytosine967-C5)-methyltransferase